MSHPLGFGAWRPELPSRDDLVIATVDRGQQVGFTWARMARELGFANGKALKNHVKKLARERVRASRKAA